MVLLIVCLIWLAALLPPLIRHRLEGDPVESIGKFNRHLSVLRSTSPAASALAGSVGSYGMPRAWVVEARRLGLQRRRRQVARSLLILAAGTLVVGLLPGLHAVLALHVITDIFLVAYLTMLAKARKVEAIRRRNEARARAGAAQDVTPAAAEAVR